MVIQQNIDKQRNPYKHTLYAGTGFSYKTSKAYYNGGFIDLASITNAGKTAAEFVQNNKDLIQTGVSTVGKVIDLGKSISESVKKSKEVEQIKELRAKKKPKIEYKFTPEQEERMQKLGSGFSTFSK